MTGNNNIFLDLNSNIKSQVKFGNGVLIQVKGKGANGIQTKKGFRTIPNVLLVEAKFAKSGTTH